MTDFISAPFYDLFHQDWYMPKTGRNLSPLLAGVRRSITYTVLITVSSAARQAGQT